jgi:hypothetical protein
MLASLLRRPAVRRRSVGRRKAGPRHPDFCFMICSRMVLKRCTHCFFVLPCQCAASETHTGAPRAGRPHRNGLGDEIPAVVALRHRSARTARVNCCHIGRPAATHLRARSKAACCSEVHTSCTANMRSTAGHRRESRRTSSSGFAAGSAFALTAAAGAAAGAAAVAPALAAGCGATAARTAAAGVAAATSSGRSTCCSSRQRRRSGEPSTR